MAEQTPPSRPTSASAPPVRPKSARGRREWIAYNQTPATASQVQVVPSMVVESCKYIVKAWVATQMFGGSFLFSPHHQFFLEN